MGIRIEWGNAEKTVLYYHFDSVWTWDDFFSAKREAYDEIATVPHKVGVILETPPDVRIPPSMLSNARSALQNKHPNTEIVVIVIRQQFLRTMINVLLRISVIAARSLQMAANGDEALELVAQRMADVTISKRPSTT